MDCYPLFHLVETKAYVNVFIVKYLECRFIILFNKLILLDHVKFSIPVSSRIMKTVPHVATLSWTWLGLITQFLIDNGALIF